MKETELAWAAGLFDGEGWVGGDEPKRGKRLRLNLSQNDRYVLDRFKAAVGVGNVTGPYGPYQRALDKNRNRKPHFQYDTQDRYHIWEIYSMLKPYLSPIKCQQFEIAIEIAGEGRVHHVRKTT